MEYILFIHKNTDTPTAEDSWKLFSAAARECGLFQGGSEIANRIQIGDKKVSDITEQVGGFMRFESEDSAAVKKLLQSHPVFLHGGTLELYEMPKT